MDPRPRQLTVFIPCTSIENFSVRRTNRETNEIFSGWAATFHPTFLDALDLLPNWSSADYLPDRKSPGIAYLPPCAEDRLPSTEDETDETPFRVLRGISDRHEVAEKIAELLGIPLAPIDPMTMRAFEGLGIGFFLLEVLGRQYRYMSNLNTDRFRAAVKAAARAAIDGDATETDLRLHDAYDRLLESREYFFPSGVHFLDFILTDPDHVGAPFREMIRQLKRDSDQTLPPEAPLPPIDPESSEPPIDPTTILDTDLPDEPEPESESHAAETPDDTAPRKQKVPMNLWVTGQTLERMDAQTLQDIRTLMDRGELGMIGGTYSRLWTSLLTPEDLREQFLEGMAVYTQRLGSVPNTFGSRQFALTATLPAVLKNVQIENALHFALDDGMLPELKQSRIRWRGIGSGAVESVRRAPFAASDSKAWMRVPEQIGSPYGVDKAPTLVVARWPGQEGWVMEIFRTIHRYAPIFGEFRTISTYFTKTFSLGQLCESEAFEYRSPYVVQAVAAREVDPITRWVRHYRRRFYADTIRSLMTLYTTILPKRCDLPELRELLATAYPMEDDSGATASAADSGKRTATISSSDFNEKIDFARFFPSFSRETESGDGDFGGDRKLRETLQELVKRFAHQLAQRPGKEMDGRSDAEPSAMGTLRFNPWCVPVTWRGQTVEPLGFRWMPTSSEAAPEDATGDPPTEIEGESTGNTTNPLPPESTTLESTSLALEFDETERQWTLRNDFVHVIVDAVTGEIRSLRSGLRRNRLGLKLAYHSVSDARAVGGKANAAPGAEAEYSLSAADRIEILAQTSDEVAMRIHGRLVHRDGTQLAGFRWTLRLGRTSPILDCDVELEPHVLPDTAAPEFRNPWFSAYVLQTAWSNGTASLSYSAHLMRVDAGECPEGAVQSLDSPHFIHLRTQNTRYTLLCDGLPFHRRYGSRRLDTLLIPAGETGRRFRFAISTGDEAPAVAAMTRFAEDESMAQWLAIPCEAPAQTDAWWYQIEPANVILTGWEPLLKTPEPLEGESPEGDLSPMVGAPEIVGVTARILETEGRETHAVLTTYRNVKNAIVTRFTGNDPRSLAYEDDEVRVTLDPHQWRQVEIRW